MLKKGLLPDFRVRAMLKTKDLQVRRSRFSEFFSILLVLRQSCFDMQTESYLVENNASRHANSRLSEH